MSHDLEKMAARAAPAIFVVLWSTGFVATKYVVNNADPKKILRIFDIIGLSYFNTSGRTFLGSGNTDAPAARVAPPGDYAVILIAGQSTMKQPLHVERATGRAVPNP